MKQYKIIDEYQDAIIDEQPLEWKVLVSTEELLDPKNGPSLEILIEQDKPKESEEELGEALSTTPIDSELDKQQ